MDKDGQEAQGNVTKRKAEVPAADRGDQRALETKQADRTIKDALEDDEVREVLNLHHRDKRT